MFWPVVLLAVLGIGAIVFMLTRDSFRASRARRETPPVASPVQRSSDASAINAMMQQKLPPPSPSPPAALFADLCGKEADAFADTLAKVQEKPILIDGPKTYLRLEEQDNTLEHLLARRLQGRGPDQAPPREFSIGVTEKKEAPLEQKNSQ